MRIDGGGVDGNVGVMFVEVLQPFRCRQKREELDGLGARLLDPRDRSDGRVAGGWVQRPAPSG